ncbi:MAG: aldo/keto reductase [Microcoleaceae cyanobacterium]
MHYRRFGRTELHLSVFSLGTMRYLASEENAVQTIQRAVALGINHLETARAYGNSEKYLATALKSPTVNRSELHITSKVLPCSSPDAIEQAIDQSLERLGLGYLDTLALHGINTETHLEQALAGMGGLQRALDDGRVRHLGFSTHGPLEVILAAIQTDYFEFINLHYYYFFQRNAPAVDLAHQRDMGIFIISPADKGGQLHTPPNRLANLCQPFSPLQLNYRFLLSDPRITTLSLGAANPQELEVPLQVANQDGELTGAEQAILQSLEAAQSEALGSTQCRQCYQCLPCPEAIHIPEVLRLRNLAIGHNMTEFGQYRYRMFESAGHWFPGRKANRCTECGDCLPRCPEQLDIPALLQETHEMLKGRSSRRLWESE